MAGAQTLLRNQRLQHLRDHARDYIGKRVARTFDGTVYHGTVTAYDADAKWWRIRYDDDDEEERNAQQLLPMFPQRCDSAKSKKRKTRDEVDDDDDDDDEDDNDEDDEDVDEDDEDAEIAAAGARLVGSRRLRSAAPIQPAARAVPGSDVAVLVRRLNKFKYAGLREWLPGFDKKLCARLVAARPFSASTMEELTEDLQRCEGIARERAENIIVAMQQHDARVQRGWSEHVSNNSSELRGNFGKSFGAKKQAKKFARRQRSEEAKASEKRAKKRAKKQRFKEAQKRKERKKGRV
ncbi:tudor domain-containing protein [Pseudoscourfieldia marina]